MEFRRGEQEGALTPTHPLAGKIEILSRFLRKI
jgi:hypothetical protein